MPDPQFPALPEPDEALIQATARELFELTGTGSTGTGRIVAQLRLQIAELKRELALLARELAAP